MELNYLKIKEQINDQVKGLYYYDSKSIDIEVTKGGKGLSFYFFNVAFFRIEFQKNKTKVNIKSQIIPLLSLSSEYLISQLNELWVDVAFLGMGDWVNNFIPTVVEKSEKIYEFCYLSQDVSLFGCCSRFIKCSDSLACVQPDKLLAKGCLYRQHLESGRIFYGKNRNT